MRLLSVFSRSHEALKNDWFLKTFQDRFPIDLRPFDPEARSDGDFLSPQWYSVTSFKLKAILEAIERHPGDILVWCDVDVQFFRPCESLFEAAVDRVDMALQNERGRIHVNTGVMVIKCNDRTRRFFEKATSRDVRDYWLSDQSLIEELLLSSDEKTLSWAFLPDSIFAPTQILMNDPFTSLASAIFPDRMLELRRDRIPSDIALHHANMTWPRWGRSSVELKIQQLRRIRGWADARGG